MKQKIYLFLQYLLLLAGILVPIFLIHQYILIGRTILLPDKGINEIAIDSKDRVWIATYDGVFMIENMTTTSYDINGLSMYATSLVGIDENDQVWIIAAPYIKRAEGGYVLTYSDTAIYRFDGNGWIFQKKISINDTNEIPCCKPGDEMTVTDIQLREYSPFFGSGELLRDKQGNLWAAGTKSGLIRFSPNFHPPSSLLTNFHIFLSKGGYWILGVIITALFWKPSVSKKQTNAVLVVTQSERLPLMVEWGLSPLLIFASALGVGGFAIFGTDIPLILLGTFSILLGALGGCIVGFLPYIARRWQISRAGWWAWTFVISALIVIDFILIWHFLNTAFVGCDTCPLVIGIPVLGIYITGVSVTLGAITSMVVALITRWVYRRWQTIRDGWWTWTVAGILIIVSIYISLSIMAMMFAQ